MKKRGIEEEEGRKLMKTQLLEKEERALREDVNVLTMKNPLFSKDRMYLLRKVGSLVKMVCPLGNSHSRGTTKPQQVSFGSGPRNCPHIVQLWSCHLHCR